MSADKVAHTSSWAKTNDGLEIYFETTGEGQPIIFQSGYMGIHDIWVNQVKAMSKKYKCITHDNRGYGMSSAPTDVSYYSMEKNADDLKAILDTLNIKQPVVIVTHSIGGTISVAFTMKYPELVKGIILTGGPALSNKLFKKAGATPDIWAKIQQTPTQRRDFYMNIGLSEDIASEASKWNPKAFTLQTNALLDFEPNYEEVKKLVTQKVWILHSKDDNISPEEFVHEFVNTLPNIKYILKEKFKHFPPTEAPEIVNNLIAEFTSELNY